MKFCLSHADAAKPGPVDPVTHTDAAKSGPVTPVTHAGIADRWSSGNIFASFGSRVRRQLGASGKSDGLESMKDIDDALPDWEDMSVGQGSFKSRDMRDVDDEHPNPDNLE